MSGLNPNRYIPLHGPDKQIEVTPLKERFKEDEIASLAQCLKEGYKFIAINEFQKDQNYLTVVELDGEERSLRTASSLPIVLSNGKKTKEQVAIEQLEQLLEEMKAEKTNL